MAKNLSGTKTHQNLKDAFAGESQANRRYLYFAQQADVEGLPEIAGNFKETADAELSTLTQLVDADFNKGARVRGTSYNVETVSLNDLLKTHQAPREIDYMSIDTEGSELPILEAFDFARYDVKVMTVEHNFVEPARGDRLPAKAKDQFAVRFHLHPLVKASRLNDMHGVLLMLPNREVWLFSGYDEKVTLEESVYLAGPDGPRRAVQIVIYGHAREHPKVHWSFRHTTPVAPGAKHDRSDEPELPL